MTLGRAIGRAFLIALASGAIAYSLHAVWFNDGVRTDASAVFAWQVFFLGGLATMLACYVRPHTWWWSGLAVGVLATVIGLNGTPLPFEGAARAIIFDYTGPIIPDGGGGGGGGDGRVLVAAGDSYSSGEGNPPFDRGTGSGCRRSGRSWNRNLDAASSRSLDVVHVACSGAVMEEVTESGRGGEAPQVQQIRQTAAFSHIDAVTLTIGGNDAGFSLLASACFKPGQSCRSDSDVARRTRSTVTSDQFIDQLSSTYSAVREAADGAPLFVMNYPIAFEINVSSRQTCVAGSGLDAAFRADAAEQETAIAFQVALNRAVSRAVDQAGNGVHLIDVERSFQDHPLCGDDSFYVPLDLGTEDRFLVPQKAFHPNARGQERLREVADEAIDGVL